MQSYKLSCLFKIMGTFALKESAIAIGSPWINDKTALSSEAQVPIMGMNAAIFKSKTSHGWFEIKSKWKRGCVYIKPLYQPVAITRLVSRRRYYVMVKISACEKNIISLNSHSRPRAYLKRLMCKTEASPSTNPDKIRDKSNMIQKTSREWTWVLEL